MFTVRGKFGEAVTGITRLLNLDLAGDAHVRIMPDAHVGKGCVIGTTMRVTDRVIPNLVGVDIGCGVLAREIPPETDFAELDAVIRESVPSGANVHKTGASLGDIIGDGLALESYGDRCQAPDYERAGQSLGTLGGGNHFIEVDADGEGRNWLIIHSGSRKIGLEVATFYQNLAARNLGLKGRYAELAWLSGKDRDNCLADMGAMQRFARENRRRMTSSAGI